MIHRSRSAKQNRSSDLPVKNQHTHVTDRTSHLGSSPKLRSRHSPGISRYFLFPFRAIAEPDVSGNSMKYYGVLFRYFALLNFHVPRKITISPHLETLYQRKTSIILLFPAILHLLVAKDLDDRFSLSTICRFQELRFSILFSIFRRKIRVNQNRYKLEEISRCILWLPSEPWSCIFHIHIDISYNSYVEGFEHACAPSKANNFLRLAEAFILSNQRAGSSNLNFIIGSFVSSNIHNHDRAKNTRFPSNSKRIKLKNHHTFIVQKLTCTNKMSRFVFLHANEPLNRKAGLIIQFRSFFLLQEKNLDKRRLSKEILKIIVIFRTLYIFFYFLQFVRKLEDAKMHTVQKYMKFPECSICSDIG